MEIYLYTLAALWTIGGIISFTMILTHIIRNEKFRKGHSWYIHLIGLISTCFLSFIWIGIVLSDKMYDDDL